MKKIMQKARKIIISFICLIVGFNILLYISCSFDSKWIKENVEESAKILIKEGNLHKFFEYYDVENNNYTDSLIINEAYSVDSRQPFLSYMLTRKNYNKDNTKIVLDDVSGESMSFHAAGPYDPVTELEEYLKGNVNISVKYARYWHGYLSIYRPLLLFFNISQIRILFLIIFIILFFSVCMLIKSKISTKASIVFASCLILEDYFYVSYSLESAPVFITMMLSVIILLKFIDKIKEWYVFMFIIACITNFVDYLTVPLITLAIPLMIYLLYNKEMSIKEQFMLMIKTSIIWGLGYGLTWFAKWGMYDVIYKEGLIKSAITQAVYRSSGSTKGVFYVWKQISYFILNKVVYIIPVLFMTGVIGLYIYIYKKYVVKPKNILAIKFCKENIKKNIVYVIISFMPILWYVLLGQHTILHVFFVYRHLIIFFLGLSIYISNLFSVSKKKC